MKKLMEFAKQNSLPLPLPLPLATAILLSIVSTILLYPGYFSFDSWVQYAQAIGKMPISDRNPPFLTYIWGGMIDVTSSAGSFMALNQGIYWLAALVFSSALATGQFARTLLLVFVGLWPPAFMMIFHVWADAAMLAAL